MAAQLWQGATAGEPKLNRVTRGLRGLVSDSSTNPRVTVDQPSRPRLAVEYQEMNGQIIWRRKVASSTKQKP